MEASTTGQDVVGTKADCNAIGEQRLDDVDGRPVVGRAVLRDDHDGIADVEVHIARGNDVAVLVGDSPGGGQGDNVEPRIGQPPCSVLVDGFVWVVPRRGWDRHPAGGDKPREIVDVPVGVIVHQAGAEPDDPLEAEIVE